MTTLTTVSVPDATSHKRPIDYLSDRDKQDFRSLLIERENGATERGWELSHPGSEGLLYYWNYNHESIVSRWGGLRRECTVKSAYTREAALKDIRDACSARSIDLLQLRSDLSMFMFKCTYDDQEKSHGGARIDAFSRDRILSAIIKPFLNMARSLPDRDVFVSCMYPISATAIEKMLLEKRMPDGSKMGRWLIKANSYLDRDVTERTASVADQRAHRYFARLYDAISEINDMGPSVVDPILARMNGGDTTTVTFSVHPCDYLRLGHLGCDGKPEKRRDESCYRANGEYTGAPIAILQSKNSVIALGDADFCQHQSSYALDSEFRCWGALDYESRTHGDAVFSNYYHGNKKGDVGQSLFRKNMPDAIAQAMGWEKAHESPSNIKTTDNDSIVYLNGDNIGWVGDPSDTSTRVFRVDCGGVDLEENETRQCTNCANHVAEHEVWHIHEYDPGRCICEHCADEFVIILDSVYHVNDVVDSEILGEPIPSDDATEVIVGVSGRRPDYDYVPDSDENIRYLPDGTAVYVE